MSKDQNYTLREKNDVLDKLDANDGNISKTSRETGVSRPTITGWEKKRKEIKADFKNIQSIELPATTRMQMEADGADDRDIEIAKERHYEEITKFGATYQDRKRYMAVLMEDVTFTVIDKLKTSLDADHIKADDLRKILGTAIDKLGKLVGEPDKIVIIRTMIKEQFVETLFRAVGMGLIDFRDDAAKKKVADMFDSIEEAEYEDVG